MRLFHELRAGTPNNPQADGETETTEDADYAKKRTAVRPSGSLLPSSPAASAPANHEPLAPLAETVVVVSGFPRSGTSMIMQMLAAGGLPVLTDERRTADDDNPLGYFEFEPVKRLHENADWLADAAGRAVKVVVPLLPYLPREPHVRIVLVDRDLDEVLIRMHKCSSGAASGSTIRRRGAINCAKPMPGNWKTCTPRFASGRAREYCS